MSANNQARLEEICLSPPGSAICRQTITEKRMASESQTTSADIEAARYMDIGINIKRKSGFRIPGASDNARHPLAHHVSRLNNLARYINCSAVNPIGRPIAMASACGT